MMMFFFCVEERCRSSGHTQGTVHEHEERFGIFICFYYCFPPGDADQQSPRKMSRVLTSDLLGSLVNGALKSSHQGRLFGAVLEGASLPVLEGASGLRRNQL